MDLTDDTQFTRAYVEAMLWASTDDDGEPLGDNYGPSDISDEAAAAIRADCARFEGENYDNWKGQRIYCELNYSESELAGHDFFLTRNGHGAGFWDGDWKHGDVLTAAAEQYRESNPYVGDDGQIYLG